MNESSKNGFNQDITSDCRTPLKDVEHATYNTNSENEREKECKNQSGSGGFFSESNMKTMAGLVGNILEWYDFACFGYFSDIFADQFFPEQNGNAALIESFAIFGGAFIMRPIGGVCMGYIGDKFGRQRALMISVFLMAFPTFAMGCLPTYEFAGILSPILLLIVRLLQGFSVGGQLMSSLVFTVERHPKRYWGFYGSIVMATANLGTVLGGVMSTIMRISLSDEALYSYGWRIPFLLGILVSTSGFYLRNHADDGNVAPVTNPIKGAFLPENRLSLISTVLVSMLWSSGFYITYVWMAIFMADLIETPVPHAFILNALSLFITNVILFPISGVLADKYGTTAIMSISGFSMILLGYRLVCLIGTGEVYTAFIAQSTLGIILASWGGPMMRWLVESFPPEVRLTSVAFGYNIAQATIGGMSPGFATYLVGKYGSNSPGYFLSVVGTLSTIGLFLSPMYRAYSGKST